MAQQAEMQALLEIVLGSENVYLQPPTNFKMDYPCIRYELDDMIDEHADNLPYNTHERYTVTVIDRDPTSAIPGKVKQLPMSSFSRFYRADGLNHFVFNLFL